MTRVLLFGRLADVAGWREQIIDLPVENLSSLRDLIGEVWPDLSAALAGPGVRVAVDLAVVDGDAPLAPDAEVAFLPPMSGG